MIYCFDGYTLDTQRYELCRDGARVDLRGRPFDALVFLLRHRDRAVLQDELFEHLWPNTLRSNASLENCIKKVRRALGDTGHGQRFIKTVRGRGYSFILPVSEAEPVSDHEALPPLPSTPSPASCFDPSPVALSPPLHPDGERKQATVLVCVLAEAARLAARLGPEAMFGLVQEFFALAHSEVQRFEGTIAHFRSGGFMALFGAPLAHEDHARRAALAALALHRRLGEHATSLGVPGSAGLQVCMGMHSGLVVVGSLGDDVRTSYPALGETTQLADRLQQCADPGTILVSATTIQLIKDEVHCEVWGPVHRAGQPEAPLAYRLVAYQPRDTACAARPGRPLTRCVGRARELEFLRARLVCAEHGAGQVVGILGEPGIGKSRLLYEFRQELQRRRVVYVEAACLSYGRTAPALAVLDLLRRLCGILDTDSAATAASKLGAGLQRAGLAPDPWVPVLLHVWAIQVDPGCLASLSAVAIKTWLCDALWQLSLAWSRQQPLILAVENLHWLDPTSEACLTALVERSAAVPLLCLLTYRPSYRPPWSATSYATQVPLPCLPPRDSQQVLQAVFRTAHLPDTVTQGILTRAQGNPFFLEELARAAVESGTLAPTSEVPQTIQAVLAAGIDRLALEDKLLLQAAAVIGLEVPFVLLQALVGQPAAAVQRGLQRLLANAVLREHRPFPHAIYTFAHVLTQEVAYQSLLQRTRQRYHQYIVHMLTERFPDIVASQPALLEYHTTAVRLSQHAPPARPS